MMTPTQREAVKKIAALAARNPAAFTLSEIEAITQLHADVLYEEVLLSVEKESHIICAFVNGQCRICGAEE